MTVAGAATLDDDSQPDRHHDRDASADRAWCAVASDEQGRRGGRKHRRSDEDPFETVEDTAGGSADDQIADEEDGDPDARQSS